MAVFRGGGTSDIPVTLSRSRTFSCQDSYYANGYVPDQCGQPLIVAHIQGHLLTSSCQVGDPCNVATGDNSQTEVDYSIGGLRFVRYYHSLSESTMGDLSSGWTHQYKAQLILVSGVPAGMLRPDGLHDSLVHVGSYYASRTDSGIKVQQIGTTWVANRPDGAREVYDGTTGRLLSLNDHGRVTILQYAGDVLMGVTDAFGHALTLQYDSQHRLSAITDPAGGLIQFTYDPGTGNLTQVNYPDGRARQYVYDNFNLPTYLTGIIDENGVRFSTYQYDPQGRAIASQEAGGANAVTLGYNDTYTLTTNALGIETEFDFVGSGSRLVSRTTVGGQETWTTSRADVAVDPLRRATVLTDPRGIVTNYTYDADHLVSKVEAAGWANPNRTSTYAYHSVADDWPTQVNEAGRVTNYMYDDNGNVLSKTITDMWASEARTWTYTYSEAGQLLTADGPRTDVSDLTTYGYYDCASGNECGHIHTVTNALGQVTTYNTYSAFGEALSITDANSVTTARTYDSRGRLTSTAVSGDVTGFEYWPTGLLKKVTQADGGYIVLTYDDAHRLIRVQDGAGNHIDYTLDGLGDRTAINIHDPASTLSRTLTQTFTGSGQLLTQTGAAGTAGVTTQYQYDSDGNQAGIVAPLGRYTHVLYDKLNHPAQITDPASGLTQLSVDLNGNLQWVIDPMGFETDYYNSVFGERLMVLGADSGETDYTYDSAGNLATSTDARGAVSTYGYDALNRLTSGAYSLNGTTDQAVTYTYDGGTYGKGHLTGASDANHTMSWTYDALGHVVSKSQAMGSVALTIGYAYTNGNLSSVSTPSGQSVTYSYNGSHQITSVSVNGSTLLSSVTYEPFGAVSGWTWGNGTSVVRSHDADGNISVINTGGEAHVYGHDDASRITAITNPANSNLSWTYGYDVMDHLNAADTASWHGTFTYDASGNRLSQGGTQTASFAIAPDSNRIVATAGYVYGQLSYDDAGNVTGDVSRSFTYNNAGRMTSVTNGAVTTSYAFNALGQRVKKSSPLSTTYFVYDEAGHLIGEYNAAGNIVEETVWMGDIPVATLQFGTSALKTYYVHTDHLNTPRRITNRNTNVIVWRWDSDPFGNGAAVQNPQGSVTVTYNLRFPGQYYDSESGLNYNYSRYYDPAAGRYVESDPIGLRAGVNTYAYANGNPIIYTDPLGLYCLSDAQINGIAGSAGGALAGGAALAEFGPAGIFVGGIVGGVTGGVFGYFSSNTLGNQAGLGAAAAATSSGNAPVSGALGGAVGGAVTYGAHRLGAPDSVSVPVGSAVGGAVGGAVAPAIDGVVGGAAAGAAEGGAIGAAAGATAAAVAAALKAGNDCPCGTQK